MGHTAGYQEAQCTDPSPQAAAEPGNGAIDGPEPEALAGYMTPPGRRG